LCNAQLRFANGFIAEAYGKGEIFEQSENIFTIYGAEETLFLLQNAVNSCREKICVLSK